jgi:uncharacterized glyoxalase superfamily protein PhnB
VDDVEIEVCFTAVGRDRTAVTVEATIPPQGVDRGGTAWVRVVPKWFGRWCRRRLTAPRPQPELARLAVGVCYEKPAAAARWLADAFGFESPDPLPEGADPLPEGEYGHPWIEFRVGNASLMVFKAEAATVGPPTHEAWVAVDDLDAHLVRAEGRGAKIVQPIRQTGFRAYTAEDLEGRRWTFVQARPQQ